MVSKTNFFIVFLVFQHFLYIQRGCKLSEGFSAPKNRHRIKNKLYSESCVYRKGRNPASYVLRLLELYARMHLVNYKKKSNWLSRDMDWVNKSLEWVGKLSQQILSICFHCEEIWHCKIFEVLIVSGNVVVRCTSVGIFGNVYQIGQLFIKCVS